MGECVVLLPAAVTAKAGEGTGHRPSQASGAAAPVGVGGAGAQI